MVKLTLRLPGDLHRQLAKRARKSNKSLNQVIVDAVRHGLSEPPVEETEYELARRALREAGLLSEPPPIWQASDAEPPTHEELRRLLKGVPPLSSMIIEDRGPR